MNWCFYKQEINPGCVLPQLSGVFMSWFKPHTVSRAAAGSSWKAESWILSQYIPSERRTASPFLSGKKKGGGGKWSPEHPHQRKISTGKGERFGFSKELLILWVITPSVGLWD